jgi:uncharacterized protein (DUF1810 family)
MNERDPYSLQRFPTAQAEDYECALAELERGRKESHWIWYIFPQVAGLDHSPMAKQYGIRSKGEAVAYLEHPVLGARLEECCEALLKNKGKRGQENMESPDNLKLRSSMTLFAKILEPGSVFDKVLIAFYAGRRDIRTVAFLAASETPARRKWRVDFWDIVMNIIQMAGIAGTSILLKRFTPLPFWACFLIGFPLFLAVFLTLIYVLFGRRYGRGKRQR